MNEKEINENETNLDETNSKTKKTKLEKRLEELEEHKRLLTIETLELKDKLLRNEAEKQNFMKRLDQERILDRKYAASQFINEILNPIDNLIKAANFTSDNALLNNFLIGFKMISDQLVSALENEGIKEIPALNLVFNPNLHQAVEKVCDKTKVNGINVEVLQKGYMYKDRILRPAMVKVNETNNNENKEEKKEN